MDFGSTATADALDDTVTVMPALQDERAATADVNTETVMVAAIAVAIAISTDADIDAAALATLPHAHPVSIASTLAALTSPLAPIPLAALASAPVATFAALGTGQFSTRCGPRLGAALSSRPSLSCCRSAPCGDLSLGIGILRESRTCA